MELSKYNSNLTYSYVFGAFGTIELLNNKSNQCLAVIIDPSFVNNEAFNKIKTICKEKNIQLLIDLKLISKIRDKGNIFVVGVFKKYESKLSNSKHIILNEVDDVGVIGTIIRSMKGFDFENLVLINCDIDLYHYHLIRATMGAFFNTNIKCYRYLEDYLNDYPNQTIYNISKRGNSLNTIKEKEKISLFFSNKEIYPSKLNNIEFKESIPLENIVNIVLFTLYK